MAPMVKEETHPLTRFFFSESGAVAPYSVFRPATLLPHLLPLGIALGAVLLSAGVFWVASTALAFPLHTLIGVVAAFCVGRSLGAFSGTLYVWGWLYALHLLSNVLPLTGTASVAQYCEMAILFFCAVGIGCWMKHTQNKLAQLQNERAVWNTVIQSVEKRQRRFLREVLATVTQDHLHLCETVAELPAPLAFAPGESSVPLASAVLSDVRARIREAGCFAGLSDMATGDLVIAGSEAALNAVVHATGGVAEIRAVPGRVQLWVRDNGSGIDDGLLHRATLEAGFSSKGTLGQGFSLMVTACQRIYLLTGKSGTTIVMEADASAV